MSEAKMNAAKSRRYKVLDDNIDFSFPEQEHRVNIIKVIGVGGGGGNAINHMFNQGVKDVSFAICNTDKQALENSPVPMRVQLGSEGLGAGNNPDRARQAAEESIDAIRELLSDGTKMVFITAGMGGGTGTGAAPIIAREAKSLGILTVGIVTIPFKWEGEVKITKALKGVRQMSEQVDSLLVINNERLLGLYQNCTMDEAFAKADDTLSVAARSIADIITLHGKINLDFNDVKNVLQNGGVAIMNTAYADGEKRITRAIDEALRSPLLNRNDVYLAHKILLNISYSNEGENGEALQVNEMQEVNEFMGKFKGRYDIKWGFSTDASLGKKAKVTILATGFSVDDVTADNQEETAEDIHNREQEDADRRKFYGDDNNGPRQPKPLYLYRFTAETIDNDNVIADVEETPSYKRNKKVYDSIVGRARGGEAVDEAPAGSSYGAASAVPDSLQTLDFTKD